MGRWLTFLEKAGMVELTPEERARASRPKKPAAPDTGTSDLDRLLAETQAMAAGTPTTARRTTGTAPPPTDAAPPAEASSAAPLTETQIFAGRSLEQVFLDAEIPASPFSADQLLRILDGLKAMEPAMRRAAIHAMDSADDSWNLNDPLLDAQRKVEALQAAMVSLEVSQEQAETEADVELQEQADYLSKATQTIQEQIAELQEMLKLEEENVAESCERIRSALQQKRVAIQREGARYQQAILRLESLADTFPQSAE